MSSKLYQRIVIFDFDGVLADTLVDMLRFSDEVAAEFGIHHHTTLQDLEALQPMSFANLGRQIGVAETEIARYVQKMIERFETSPTPCPIFPGMTEVVTKLKADTILAIVSGNTRTVIQRFLEYYSLSDAFQQIYGVDQPGGKVEKIKQILAEIALPDLPAIMIGDAASDIEAAHQAGIIAIAVGWGHQPQSKLIQARPDYFVTNPQELLDTIMSIKPIE